MGVELAQLTATTLVLTPSVSHCNDLLTWPLFSLVSLNIYFPHSRQSELCNHKSDHVTSLLKTRQWLPSHGE